MKKAATLPQVDLGLDDDLELDLEDQLDLFLDADANDDTFELEDDMFSLDDLPFERLVPLDPPLEVQLATCRQMEADIKAKRVKDMPRISNLKDNPYQTIIPMFKFWWAKYGRDKNKTALNIATMCAARLRSQIQRPDIVSSKFPRDILEGEPCHADGDNVLLMIGLPDKGFSNIQGGFMDRARLVWFNAKTGRPLDSAEPFRMV